MYLSQMRRWNGDVATLPEQDKCWVQISGVEQTILTELKGKNQGV